MWGRVIAGLAVLAVSVSATMGGTVSFVADGAATVPPGADLLVDVTVSVETLEGMATADLIIGSNDATDLEFTYSGAWLAAFSNVSPVMPDVGFYDQDVFIGGNSGASNVSVGSSLQVGRLTITTAGLAEGAYVVEVDSAKDNGASSLTFSGEQEVLQGAFTFTIECVAADADCDGRVSLSDSARLADCMNGPEQASPALCDASDVDEDTDVDLSDFAILARTFTGE